VRLGNRATALAFLLFLSLGAHAQIGDAYAQVVTTTARPLLARNGPDAIAFRGSLVFFNYCATCHGPNADGNGRAARLYDPRPANLRASDKDVAYMKVIVRNGGKALGRSEYMPPWGEELTDEQIDDVTAYLQSINNRHQ
jgi:mono/diheme cytochrome c family protein